MIDQGDGGCTTTIDCSQLSTVQKIQAYMGGRNPNTAEAMKLIVIYYNIDTQGASVSYDENLQDGGGIDDSGNIVIGPSANRSVDFLGSIIFHESVHVDQRVDNRSFANGQPYGYDPYVDAGWALNELEAYDSQMNDSRFDLTENDTEFLNSYRKIYYALISWNFILDYRVSQGIYTLDDLPEVCVTNPNDAICKPYGPPDLGGE